MSKIWRNLLEGDVYTYMLNPECIIPYWNKLTVGRWNLYGGIPKSQIKSNDQIRKASFNNHHKIIYSDKSQQTLKIVDEIFE
jgi:hypothetical protein